MGVTLERVQFKFASIIGELCSEPRVLSQFAVWLDLRLAEYKLKGSISLECSNDKPDPTWLEGIKDEKPIVEDDLFLGSMIKKRKLSHRDSISSLNRASPHEFSGHTSDEMLPESSLRVHDRRSHPAAVSDFPVTGFVDELPVNNSMGLQVKSETSSSRRKRLPGSIIRNTNVVEDDVIEDRVGTLQHSFDSPTDLPVFNVQRSSEDPGDKSGMSLSPCQREATSARGEVEQTITASLKDTESLESVASQPIQETDENPHGTESTSTAKSNTASVHPNSGLSPTSLYCVTCDNGVTLEEAKLHVEMRHIIKKFGDVQAADRVPVDKPFVCSVCSRAFQEKRYLREHSKVHASTPSRKCPNCGQLFVWRASLNNHLKKCPGSGQTTNIPQ